MTYIAALQDTELLVKDEGTRRLRLRILMLENENDELHEQLALGDDRNDTLVQEVDGLRSQLGTAKEELSKQEEDIRSKARELNKLKVRHPLQPLEPVLTIIGGIKVDDWYHLGLCEITYGKALTGQGTGKSQTGARTPKISSITSTDHPRRETGFGTPS